MIYSNERGSVIDQQIQQIFYSNWYEWFQETSKMYWLEDLANSQIKFRRNPITFKKEHIISDKNV